jgi:hypothetical protein
MSTTEMMFEYLQKEGFLPVKESFGLAFRYQMKNYLFLENDDDPSFFQLVMPGICDVNDQNRLDVYRAMDATNSSVKVAKASIFDGDSVWLYCELLIDSTPQLGDIVPRALGILQHAYKTFAENY